MAYLVIMTQNGVQKRILKRTKTKKPAFLKYWNVVEESENVIFDRRFVNTKGIIPITQHVYIVTDTPHWSAKPRKIKQPDGTFIEEPLLFGKYLILHDSPYKEEEEFFVFGYDPRFERKKIHDVVKIMMEGMEPYTIKEVITILNKVVVYNEDYFHLIICKCHEDAMRLQRELYAAAKKAKLKGFMFMGKSNWYTSGELLSLIMEETGWNSVKVNRPNTRP